MESMQDTIAEWIAGLPTRKRIDMIGADTDLIDQGILDSLAILNLVAFLEERFNVTLSVEEFVPENFRTQTAIVELAARLSKRAV